MKLLLTSGGLTNETLRNAVERLATKPIRIAFIPTAANVKEGEKSWLVNDLVNCQKLGAIDIVDIAALDKKLWLPRLKKATVIVFGGGSSTYLMEQIRNSGLQIELPRLLKKRVYIGISAGSTVASKTLQSSSNFLFREKPVKSVAGLNYVQFYLRPHFNSPHYPKYRDTEIRKRLRGVEGDLYALDDDSAILFENGKITVLSEGTWKLYKKPEKIDGK